MKKLLALMLSVMMVMCMMPSMVFANTGEGGSNFTLSSKEAMYNGQDQRPTVLDNGNAIDLRQYEVTWTKNETTQTSASDIEVKDVGVYTATVTAKTAESEAPGTKNTTLATLEFKITAKPLSRNMFSIKPQVTDVSEIVESDITAKDGTMTLTKDTDYTIGQVTKQTTGNYTVKLTGNGNYTGDVDIPFRVGTNLSGNYTLNVNLPANWTPTYTGSECRIDNYITVTKTSADTTLPSSLTKDRDYIIRYENAINVTTTAKVVVEGIGQYVGTLNGTFSIKAKDINTCSITPPDNIPTGTSDVAIDVLIKDGTKTLVKNSDYFINVTYSGSQAFITVTGAGNYTGTKLLYTNTGASIEGAEVTLYPTTFEYTGSAITPQLVTVKLGNTLLKQYTDYKLVYEDNIKVGTAKMKVVGVGKYAGTIEKTFPITAKSITGIDTTVTLPESVLYDGKPATPAVTVKTAGRTLVKDVDYTLSYYNNTAIGTATVFINGKGNYTGSVSKTFKIAGKDIASMTATLSSYNYKYTGLECKPTVTVYDGIKRLYSGTDYTVEYKNNKNAGTASVVITGKGNYSGTKTINFTIEGKYQTVTTNYTYYTKYLTSSSFNLNGKATEGTITYTSSAPNVATVSATGTVTIKGTGIAYITVATKNNVEYNPAEKVVKVTVKPLKPAIKVSSPAKKEINVQITKVEGATKYQVRYGRNGKYYNKYVTHVDNIYSTISTTIGNRKSGTNYFVKVRAYKTMPDGEKAWGNWTTTKKIKAK